MWLRVDLIVKYRPLLLDHEHEGVVRLDLRGRQPPGLDLGQQVVVTVAPDLPHDGVAVPAVADVVLAPVDLLLGVDDVAVLLVHRERHVGVIQQLVVESDCQKNYFSCEHCTDGCTIGLYTLYLFPAYR